MNPYVDALNAINDANLPPAVLRTANRLLALVHQDNGYITLSWDETMAICGVRNRKSVWRNLGALKAAKIIHYSTNDAVDVAFEAWRTLPNERMEPPKREGGTSHFRTANATQDRPLSQTREWNLSFQDGERDAGSATLPNERMEPPKREGGTSQNGHPIGWLVGNDPTTLSDKSFNQPTNQNGRSVSLDEQRRNLALLTDPEVGVWRKEAERLASEHDFEWTLRHVCAWREDITTGKVSSPRVLVHRLDNGRPPGDLTERDRASPLYRRHVSEKEDRERDNARYVPDEFATLINT